MTISNKEDGHMANQTVISGVMTSKLGRKKPLRKVVVIIGSTILLIIVASAFTVYYTRNRSKANQVVQVATPELKPEEFVTSQKENTVMSTGTDSEKIATRVAAANYYSNTYEFDKVLAELDLITKDFPSATQDYNFNVSYFKALIELNRVEEMKVYAKKIVALEAAGAKSVPEMPSELRKVIIENSK